MSAEKYRLYARHCFQIAENATDPGTKLWLIELAQSWLVLAEQAEKNLASDLVYETPTPPPEAPERPVAQQQQQIQPKKEDE